MRKTVLPLLAALVLALALPVAQAQEPAPSIRFVTVEGMRNVTVYVGVEETPIPAVHYNFTFALQRVAAQNDRVNFRTWINQQSPEIVASWYISFSNDTVPGLRGMGGVPGYVYTEVNFAEFPYASESVDGTVWHYYRVHTYIASTLVAKETIIFGAAYVDEPTLEGSTLLRVKVKDVTEQGVAIYNIKVLHEE